MPVLVYVRGFLFLPEFVWACLGAVWVSNYSTGCEPAEVGLVVSTVIVRWVKSRPSLHDKLDFTVKSIT